jgi:hypothetical protein
MYPDITRSGQERDHAEEEARRRRHIVDCTRRGLERLDAQGDGEAGGQEGHRGEACVEPIHSPRTT